MKESDKRRTQNSTPSKRSAKTEKRDRKPQQTLTGKETESKTLHAKPDSGVLVSDLNTGSEHAEVYENLVIHYVDDNEKVNINENFDNLSSDLEKKPKQGKEEESDTDTVKDSVSSQGDALTADDEKLERVSTVPKSVNYKKSIENSRTPRVKSDADAGKSLPKAVNGTPKKAAKKDSSRVTSKGSVDEKVKDVKLPSKPLSESSDGADDKLVEDAKETDVLDGASNSTQSTASDNETADATENGEHEGDLALKLKIEEMEMRIGKLEEELREVAALEISLYSVIPEHGSSAHKVHTPARRLSRLFIHACKHWTQDMRATIAKNSVSGLVLISKSCGNDVPRLSFWLSNTIVLREIIAQTFGIANQSSPLARLSETNEGGKNRKRSSGGKHANSFLQFADDWQETGTYITALEKVESWIFCRIVESVWWQALTPHMQSPTVALSSNKSFGKVLGPALGDQQQGSFSVNLWKNVFQDAYQRLCPVRAGGHDCGCLPVIARKVMQQCVSRLDVAMFNAILRESAQEIPTDPVSDPIVDSKVLPIPAGDLSFGSGAQLKNSVGTWSRLLADIFGLDAEDQHACNVVDRSNGESKAFCLLNQLSDLLMLPKDMLMDRTIRKEVCSSIDLSLVKRILCNFTPDEFCPDAVPGDVLEALNAESLVERRFLGETTRSFPYMAAGVVYHPPSSADVAEKVAEVGSRSQLSRNTSVIQRKGYTSDEELQELDSPLIPIIEKSQQSSPDGDSKHTHTSPKLANERYRLLREVWSFE